MASAQPSRDMSRSCDCQHPPSSRSRPRSESRRISDRCPMKAVAHKRDHGLGEGNVVRVFSKSADAWIEGVVVEVVEEHFVQVEYELADGRHRKILHLQSEQIMIPAPECDPPMPHVGSNFSRDPSNGECDPGFCFEPLEVMSKTQISKTALRDFKIKLQDGACGALADILSIQQHKDNVFICGRKQAFSGSQEILQPLQGHFEIKYTPTRTFQPDAVLRVHMLETKKAWDSRQLHRFTENFTEVQPGFLHTLLHEPNEKEKFVPETNSCGYWLGLTIHTNLSQVLADRMNQSEEAATHYRQLFAYHLQVGWNSRCEEECEPRAKRFADEADYLIFCSSNDRDDNNEILKRLNELPVKGPHHGDKQSRAISFCTDCSLGLGHLHDTGVGELLCLRLGKHGFAQPVAGGWRSEYVAASKQTKQGILILPSRGYFESDACFKEFPLLQPSRLWVYIKEKDEIFRVDAALDADVAAHLRHHRNVTQQA
eukprot:gnl/TRDRNA2_/TRDRNA2_172808_c5_seq8.p1 gnl/TRDRNA2_/TRDRNA2_172808_c5~~gnl/TRDRNA2_/TRDRNA2_172808_c5_seq8.p1  ORF type:complete len:485 (-),score=61.30 gnl/TRDRNA2_/TRDRNA2_172808_c5_seq8:112-1566(-)